MVGLTDGFELVEVNPLGLDVQLYVCPLVELPPIDVVEPLQMDFALPGVGVGSGLTVTLMESVLEHPVAVMLSVNL